MRLILSMMDQTEDTAALSTEVADLEGLLNGFLDYSRGVATEEAKTTVDAVALVADLLENMQPPGTAISVSAWTGRTCHACRCTRD